jgi:phage protein D
MPVTILDIEKRQADFYAPAFRVLVSGQDLVVDLYLEVISVQVENPVNKSDHFTFVVANAFNVTTREFVKVGDKTLPEFFEFGSPVEIFMGYRGPSKLPLILDGIVTEVRTSFPSSGLPQLTVSGYDHSYPLTKGTASKNWPNKRDSDVVREIAQSYSLIPKVEDTRVMYERIEKSQESPAQFLGRLAKRNGFEWFVFGKELFFRAPSNDEGGIIELAWGRGLVSFSPGVNLAEQVIGVEVHGWNIHTKQPIVGRARKGDEPGRDASRASGKKRQSGAEYLQKVSPTATLRVREPVFTQQEADQRARAMLKDRAEGFVTGRGESIGIPELKAYTNVTLRGLGDFFSMTLQVKHTTHTVDGSGYRTTFEVGDVTS